MRALDATKLHVSELPEGGEWQMGIKFAPLTKHIADVGR
jgi:hypothetical protein